MENEIIIALLEEFLVYLREPVLFEKLNDNKAVINHPIVKKFKGACNGNDALVINAMKLITRNISSLDIYKVGIMCEILCECIDIKKTNANVINFVLAMFIRNLILSDRYISKALNYIENYDIATNNYDEIKAWKILDFIAQPASIILSTHIGVRIKFRDNKNYFVILNRLKSFAKLIEQIYNIYRLADEQELVLIHPERRVGFRVVIRGVQNNYHLFTLIQSELAQKVGKLLGIHAYSNTDVVQIARGIRKFDIDRKIPDFGLISFYSWKAYYESQKQKSPLNPKHLLSGRVSPYGIPLINGIRFIILGEALRPALQWNTSEFRPLNQYLTSEVQILEVLDRNKVIDILNKIQSINITDNSDGS